MRGRDTARYLQDQVVADRNGRYVIVVRAEHRHAIPGIVHGASSSGASVYLEPLSTVELNNEIVALEDEEAAEVRRILLRLTDAFRSRALELRRTVDASAELDMIQAKARLAAACRACAPAIAADGRLELRGARHPLLIEAVVSRTAGAGGRRVAREREPVPVDVLVVPPTRVLVITGPNTGGKTVALKSAGLLALMAQAGLHLPVDAGSSVPVFQSLFADIGDEQSIDANLSTFSWHVTNIAAMDTALRTPALVLLDEIGAGTDPIEGGALGMAIIDHFRARGAVVIATTHYDALKSYASTTPAVSAAAFGFHPESYVPTYRLIYGSPGSSLALEMASRLGLRPSIVEAARSFRTDREAQLAEHLAKVDRELQGLEHERRLVVHEREQLAALEAQLRAREGSLHEREAQSRRKLDSALQDRMREASRAIDSVVDEARRKAATLVEEAARRAQAASRAGTPAIPLAAPPLSTGETGGLRADARAALEHVAEHARAPESSAAGPVGQVSAAEAGPIASGAHVLLPLGIEGVVQTVHDHTAEVTVHGKRVHVRLDELRLAKRPAAARAPQVTVHVSSVEADGASDSECGRLHRRRRDRAHRQVPRSSPHRGAAGGARHSRAWDRTAAARARRVPRQPSARRAQQPRVARRRRRRSHGGGAERVMP